MAMPVEFRRFTPRDSRRDLMRKLEQAPADHAEALLECYELLQRLHEQGVIDLANGLLSASKTVALRLTDVLGSKQAVSGLRMMLMLSNLLTQVDTDRVHGILSASNAKPPSLFKIGKAAMSEDAQLGLSAAIGLLEVFGKALRRGSEGRSTPESSEQAG